MKKLTIILIALLVIVILIGCTEHSHEQDYADNEQRTSDDHGLFGETRYYDVQTFSFGIDVDNGLFYLTIHQEQLNLFLLEENEDTFKSYVRLLTMDVDGTNVVEIYRTGLDENVDFFIIHGFEKHDDGYVSIVTRDTVILPPYTREDANDGFWDFDFNYSYVYRRISPNGTIVNEFGIDAINNDERQIIITEVIFDLDGRAAASALWLHADFEPSSEQAISDDIMGQSFFLFSDGLTGDFYEIDDPTFSVRSFNRTNDGQIFFPSSLRSHGTDMTMFYEIDFENFAIIDGPVIDGDDPIDSIGGVFPAPQASIFDFYLIGNERELFGYRKSDGKVALLFDFFELGVPLDQGMLDRNSFLLWDDGRLTAINLTWNQATLSDVTLFLLTPSDEPSPAVAEREIITLAGININFSPLVDQVTVFNRQSDTHQIEVINYEFDELDRLRTELVTGRGPDIFMLSWGAHELVTALAEGQFILDLYQLIDADPDISREDFFPSVLSTWENSRGELVQIAPDFIINTILGMQSVFPEAPENWSYADFITFYQEAREAGYDYPLGQTADRLDILEMLLFADDTFFCEQTAVANFDSESFINVLNFIMTIPSDQGWDRHSLDDLWDPSGDLLRGEQLLIREIITGTSHFGFLQVRLGGITAFGFPSNEAPTHGAQNSSGTSLGIRSNSPHIEAAWEFVRLGLLPDTAHDIFDFPLRIDLFEQMIYDEQNRTTPGAFGIPGVSYELPPMTEADADILREIVLNIGYNPVRIEHPIQNIVNEDVQAFLAGTRSAEDTARIIQSRVQRFLYERAR